MVGRGDPGIEVDEKSAKAESVEVRLVPIAQNWIPGRLEKRKVRRTGLALGEHDGETSDGHGDGGSKDSLSDSNASAHEVALLIDNAILKRSSFEGEIEIFLR